MRILITWVPFSCNCPLLTIQNTIRYLLWYIIFNYDWNIIIHSPSREISPIGDMSKLTHDHIICNCHPMIEFLTLYIQFWYIIYIVLHCLSWDRSGGQHGLIEIFDCLCVKFNYPPNRLLPPETRMKMRNTPCVYMWCPSLKAHSRPTSWLYKRLEFQAHGVKESLWNDGLNATSSTKARDFSYSFIHFSRTIDRIDIISKDSYYISRELISTWEIFQYLSTLMTNFKKL